MWNQICLDMSSTLKQVEKQLAAIEQSSKALANELHQSFLSYLKALGTAVKKQLILASYYLCTQGYPEAFLSLSFREKQELQSAIRQTALSAVQDLSILLTLSLRVQENLSNQSNQTDENEVETESHPANSDDLGDKSLDNENPWVNLELTNPERIAEWHNTLERGITEILRTASRKTNEVLQEYKILPPNLPDIPDILLELGAKNPGYNNEPLGNLPNIVNLTVEIGSDNDGEKSSHKEKKSPEVVKILKINLRLADIEFNDHLLTAKRNQIRELLQRLNSLVKEYEKKQKERMIAEAEAAWRASWFEE